MQTIFVQSKFDEGLTVTQSLNSVATDIEDIHIFTAHLPRGQCWHLMVSFINGENFIKFVRQDSKAIYFIYTHADIVQGPFVTYSLITHY